jgi:putative transcriptional regulator
MERAMPGALTLLLLACISPPAVPAAGAPPAGEHVQLERGVLLIASRDLRDPNFSRSVVLITHFDDSGTVGLVLNRPLPVPAAQALPPLAGLDPDPGGLFLGGPVAVSTLQLLVRTDADLDPGSKLVGNVYFVTGAEVLENLVDGRIRATSLRLYAGYAGWGPGQLESELLRGDWIIRAADPETIFASSPERLWPDLMGPPGEQWVQAPRTEGADVGAPAQYNSKFAKRTGRDSAAAACRRGRRPGFHSDDGRRSGACGRGRLLTC